MDQSYLCVNTTSTKGLGVLGRHEGEDGGGLDTRRPVAGRRRPDAEAPSSVAAGQAAERPPPRRHGGWGDEASAAPPSKMEAKQRAYGFGDTETSVIPVIPDIDDDAEDMALQVAEAPVAAFPRMPNLAELDAGIRYKLPPAADPDVDLSLLVATLSAHTQLAEGLDVWTFESLFSQVMAELQEPASIEQEQQDLPVAAGHSSVL